ncbi:MAG: hypothetical protein HY900_07865 [Deltaproteobacteria bacterium]|nr:hypothetical protein [Deltaproteobacteria bacterium]
MNAARMAICRAGFSVISLPTRSTKNVAAVREEVLERQRVLLHPRAVERLQGGQGLADHLETRAVLAPKGAEGLAFEEVSRTRMMWF